MIAAWIASGAQADGPVATEVPEDEAPKGCEMCGTWATPRAPFRLFGDAWYVGSEGLAAVAVRTSDGVVLFDGDLPEIVPQIVANLAAVGLSIEDVVYIAVSHAHYDHVGGVAALQRRSGATVVATASAAEGLRVGNVPADDPQAGFGADAMAFPPVVGPVRVLTDGEVLTLGGVRFTMHATPGHTPGGATWSWSSCEGDRCAMLVYGDSLNAVGADGYRFTDHPEVVDALRASIGVFRALPCDALVPVHPSFGRLFDQAARAERRGGRAFLDPRGCARYADGAEDRLDARLAGERAPEAH